MTNSLNKSLALLVLSVSTLSLSANTPLRDAVAKRDANKVRDLIAAGADLTQRDTQYKTEIDYAREKNTTPEIMVLLEAEQYRQMVAKTNDPVLKQLYGDRARNVERKAVEAERELR